MSVLGMITNGEAGNLTAAQRGRRHRLATILLVGITTLALSACESDLQQESSLTPEDSSPAVDYLMRLDSERSDPGQFQLALGGEGLHILTGPAGIAYRETDAVTSGDFQVEATFVQYSAPVGYREAYGIFVGGRELQQTDHEYTYLLVRPTGDFLIKRRLGEITEVVVDWTPHDAVAQVVEEGDEPTNVMAIEVVGGHVRFLVNGEAVHEMPAPEARPYGIAGIRANHRLEISMTDWALRSPATEAPASAP
jgi:hypothetical protein